MESNKWTYPDFNNADDKHGFIFTLCVAPNLSN